MLPKPSACVGCPFYDDGHGFVPDEVHPGAEVEIWAQNPGEDEEAGRKLVDWETYEPHPPAPLLGKTGRLMERSFFPLAGLQRGSVTLRNAIRCRRFHQNDLPPVAQTVMREAITHCTRAHFVPQASTRLRVAMGEHALWATTQEGLETRRTLSAWRGWVLPFTPAGSPRRYPTTVYTPAAGEAPVLVTYHLAYLFRDPSARTPAQSDWRKVSRLLAGRWPEPLPPIVTGPPERWPERAAFDTEFVMATRRLIRYSLGWRSPDEAMPRLHVVEADHADAVETPPSVTVVMHNAVADLPFLPLLIPGACVRVEDTMYKHASLWPGKSEDEGEVAVGTAHTLDYVGSLYARTNRWKHLSEINPVEYAGGDALGTWDVDEALERELTRDPQSRAVYALMLRCLPIIGRAHHDGLRLDGQYAVESLRLLDARMKDATRQAQAAVGWPINVGSPAQVAHQLYMVEKLGSVKKRWGR